MMKQELAIYVDDTTTEFFDQNEYMDTFGEIPSESRLEPHIAASLREQLVAPVEQTLAERLFEVRPQVDHAAFVARLKAEIQFNERGEGDWGVRSKLVKLVRHIHGKEPETYEHKEQKELLKGKTEAAAYGIGEIEGNRFTFFTTHIDYWAGSLGVVMGEKFSQAAELATRENLPLVGLFSSAGARQQEGTLGLKQMPKMVAAIHRFKEKTRMPYVSIVDESWGGISASSATLGDVIAGMRGTGFGFAGWRVIDQFLGKEGTVSPGAQSVEANFLNRGIDMVLNDGEELTTWLQSILEFSTHLHKKPKSLSVDDTEVSLPKAYERFPTGELRIQNKNFPQGTELVVGNAIRESHPDIFAPQTSSPHAEEMTPYQQYDVLLRNPYRVDTDLLLNLCFDTVTPMYSSVVDENKVMYRPLIWALATIDQQPYLVIGNQQSYYLASDGSPRVIPNGPRARDFRRRDQWLEVGERMKIPVISFVNTFGALPTKEEEEEGLSNDIAMAIDKGIYYKQPSFTYVVGAYGSGGGLGCGPEGDVVKMLDDAQMYVAAPESYSAILYNSSTVDRELVEDATNTGQVTAKDQLRYKLIHGIISADSGSSRSDAVDVARALRSDIIKSTRKFQRISSDKRIQQREDNISQYGHPLLERLKHEHRE